MEAAAWFAAAIAILAWPRAAPVEPATQPSAPWWRRTLKGLWSAAPINEVDAAEHDQPGRGRDATSPGAIPMRGWRDVLWRTWSEFNKDRAPAVAAGVSFYGLLATFPALTAFVSLYGLFADVKAVREQLNLLRWIMPTDSLNFVGEQMLRLALGDQGGLSLAFLFSFVVALWRANAGMKAFFDGLNIAYEEREKRGLIKLNLISLGFTLAAIVFVILILAAVVALPAVLGLIGYGGPDPMWLLRWPLLLMVVIVALAVLYRYGPSRQQARWRWVSGGSVAAAVLWLLASLAFSE